MSTSPDSFLPSAPSHMFIFPVPPFLLFFGALLASILAAPPPISTLAASCHSPLPLILTSSLFLFPPLPHFSSISPTCVSHYSFFTTQLTKKVCPAEVFGSFPWPFRFEVHGSFPWLSIFLCRRFLPENLVPPFTAAPSPRGDRDLVLVVDLSPRSFDCLPLLSSPPLGELNSSPLRSPAPSFGSTPRGIRVISKWTIQCWRGLREICRWHEQCTRLGKKSDIT